MNVYWINKQTGYTALKESNVDLYIKENMLKGCLKIVDILADDEMDPMDDLEIYENYICISNANDIIENIGSLPSNLYARFHNMARPNPLRNNKKTVDQSNAIELMRHYLEKKQNDLAFSLNDAGEWGSSYTPNKTLQNAMKKYISYDMKGKKKSYTFDEFITELSYAYKTFLHQDRIC
jgi:hypothetical protein